MKWTQIAPIPDKEGFAAPFAGVSQGSLIVAGGANFPEKKPWEGGTKVWHQTIFALDWPVGRWQEVGKLPRPLGYGVSASHRNKVICAGGSDAVKHFSDCFTLELADGKIKIEVLPSLPFPMANGCGALVGDVLYLAGGQQKPDSTTALRRVLALDLSNPAGGWKEMPSLPGPGRILAAAAACEGAFWVIGGAELSPSSSGGAARRYLSDAWKFIPSRGWERVVDMPYPVAAAPSPAPVKEGEIFILGGDDGSKVGIPPHSHTGFQRKLLKLNATTSSWAEAGVMPMGRVTVSTAFWRDSWVIPNGEDRPGIRSPEVWLLNL